VEKGVIATPGLKTELGVVLGRVRLEDVSIGLLEREADPVAVGCIPLEGVPKGHSEVETAVTVAIAVGRVIQECVVRRRLQDEAAEGVVVGYVSLEGVPMGITEEEAVAEVCDAAVLDGDSGSPFEEDTYGQSGPGHILLLIEFPYPDVGARSDDHVAITV